MTRRQVPGVIADLYPMAQASREPAGGSRPESPAHDVANGEAFTPPLGGNLGTPLRPSAGAPQPGWESSSRGAAPTPDEKRARPQEARSGGAVATVFKAIRHLIGCAGEDPAALRGSLVEVARDLFAGAWAGLVAVGPGGEEWRVLASSPATERVVLAGDAARRALAAVDGLLEPRLLLPGERRVLTATLGVHTTPGGDARLLAVPIGRAEPGRPQVFLFVDAGTVDEVSAVALARELAAMFDTVLGQASRDAERAREIARLSALLRAAKLLNETLDVPRVLTRICREAAAILDADTAVVFRLTATVGDRNGELDSGFCETPPAAFSGSERQGEHVPVLVLEAAHGLPPEAIGLQLAVGEGAAGRVAESGEPLVTDNYPAEVGAPRDVFADLRAGVSVPMRWGGRLRGVLSVGFRRHTRLGRDEVRVLEAFAELAAVACRNAAAHESLALVARTDGLTGCLNHAALHEALAREVERCRRSGHRLSLLLIDLDHFKLVNERHGHLVGDEVLRTVGYALRQSVRGFDFVARYGGDEFALVVVDATESEARSAARRARDRVGTALAQLKLMEEVGMTVGIAEWRPGEGASELVARADRALLYGKLRLGRGATVAASEVPLDFAFDDAPLPAARRISQRPSLEPAFGDDVVEQTVRLRKRTRQLALAAELGARLAAMVEPDKIVETAASELHRAFGFHSCAVLRLTDDGDLAIVATRGRAAAVVPERQRIPRDAGIVGRALRERRALVASDARAEGNEFALETVADWDAARSQAAAPVWAGGELWGAIFIAESAAGMFDEDDALAVQAVADLLGASLRSALLYERLNRAYTGTAEALAAALEAKDSYTAEHSRSLVEHAEAVARKLGLDEREVERVRLGAIFHDIGKIAVPDSILNKPGPLTDAERREMEKHTVAGERILRPIEFLRDVLPIVRHEHERWDGQGYPDGLAGEEIPIGARIVLACDAYDAMTSDRPYRPALPAEVARQELARNAGSQFDPRVVEALLEVLAERGR